VSVYEKRMRRKIIELEGRKHKKVGENLMMKSFIICNPWHYHQTDRIQGGFDERVPHIGHEEHIQWFW